MKKILWLTGNSGAGKSTVAFGVQTLLRTKGIQNVIVLDGDRMRDSISTEDDLTPEGRFKHNVRVARLAKELQQQDMQVIVSVIAPFSALREQISQICTPTWVYVHRNGLETPNKPYEVPKSPDLVLDHTTLSSDESIMLLYSTFF